MAESQTDVARRTVRRRIRKINSKLQSEADYQEFAASTDLDYRMSDARIKGLKVEQEHLKEILGDLE